MNKTKNVEVIAQLQRIITSTWLSKKDLINILESLEDSDEKEKNSEAGKDSENSNMDFAKQMKEKIETMSLNSIEKVENRLRPRSFSMEWFIGEKESLMKLLQSDHDKCVKLWITSEMIANELLLILDTFRSRNKEYISTYGKKIAIKWYWTRWSQSNPFTESREPSSSLNIFISRDGEEIQLTEMHHWLVRELWFFQWKDSCYRIDPKKFAKMVGMI